jgi:hypothetical protein
VTSPDMALLVRLMAAWSGLGSLAMGVSIAQGSMLLSRFHSPPPLSVLVVPLGFGAASVIGMFGACALWRLSRVGRLACILSGAVLIVGVAPAAILRGQGLILALLGVTLAVVLALSSRPVGRLCTR